tara:strand:- start:55 stop:429 length:375 start_codon:yes stop_codon:yes gene_type:complete
MASTNPFIDAWKRPFDFKGLTKRADFWKYALISFFINRVGTIFIDRFAYVFTDGKTVQDIFADGGMIVGYLYLAISIPFSLIVLAAIPVTLAVTVRRLRDAGKHWLWIFFPFLNIYLLTRPSKQ